MEKIAAELADLYQKTYEMARETESDELRGNLKELMRGEERLARLLQNFIDDEMEKSRRRKHQAPTENLQISTNNDDVIFEVVYIFGFAQLKNSRQISFLASKFSNFRFFTKSHSAGQSKVALSGCKKLEISQSRPNLFNSEMLLVISPTILKIFGRIKIRNSKSHFRNSNQMEASLRRTISTTKSWRAMTVKAHEKMPLSNLDSKSKLKLKLVPFLAE